MCPDFCLSKTEDESSDDSSESDEEVEKAIPSLLKDEETEFDAFLLDAVQWL